MLRLLIRLAINALAFWVVFNGIPGLSGGVAGIDGPQNVTAVIVIAVIFGFVNALVRPILTFLTCPFLILTLGLGTLLINTALFWLTGQIGQYLGVGFTVQGFWPAFFGALVVSVVSIVLSVFVPDEREWRRRDWQRSERDRN
ncbi:MAG: phage holin family protein [Anaerolineales bacterium]